MNLEPIKKALLESYDTDGGINHLDGVNLPSQESITRLAADCMHVFFPGYFDSLCLTKREVPDYVARVLQEISIRLSTEIEKSLRFSKEASPASAAKLLTTELLGRLPSLRKIIQTDVTAAYRGDPSARSIQEIILAYPCVLAISIQRLAHELYQLGVPLIPRMLTEYAHERTGMDLHPGAHIGTHLFIDHGTGVVIGETAVLGNHVKIYQGVTIGAKSFVTDSEGLPVKGVKRHPDIEDNVTIYAHATILGGDTRIGANSIISGGVWLIQSVPADSVVYQKSESLVIRSRRKKEALIETRDSHDWQI